ncbi:MAG TPA: hypothetical protein VF131_17070 [Blastocatellia bacterium]|nr:hypothetical protein [Blastocatellia bacterium]
MAEVCLNALHPLEDITETTHEGLLAISKVFFGLNQRLSVTTDEVLAVKWGIDLSRDTLPPQ